MGRHLARPVAVPAEGGWSCRSRLMKNPIPCSTTPAATTNNANPSSVLPVSRICPWRPYSRTSLTLPMTLGGNFHSEPHPFDSPMREQEALAPVKNNPHSNGHESQICRSKYREGYEP
ncbi:hypothetical protein NC652_018249 [Populus alba x Populus x berolinensis]|nr:hypothetical protein NC652_018249 [Populus alba x Populus x berolinensis]